MRSGWISVLAVFVACNSPESNAPPAPEPKAAQAPEATPEAKPASPGLAAMVDEVAHPTPEFLEPLGDEPKAVDLQVVLPSAPSLDYPPVPDKDADGHWSIDGLRRNRTAQLKAGQAGAEITVKGWVQDIYVPPVCPAGETCPPAKQPHLWIVDAPDVKGAKRALMVVNYSFVIPEWDAERWEDTPQIELERGKPYVFKGHFKKFSDTGFAHQDGLLEFVAVRQRDPATGGEWWVYPRGASWHPLQIAQMEAQAARLAKEARKP